MLRLAFDRAMSSLGNTMNPMGVRGLVRCPSFLAGSMSSYREALQVGKCSENTTPTACAAVFTPGRRRANGNPRSLAVSPLGAPRPVAVLSRRPGTLL